MEAIKKQFAVQWDGLIWQVILVFGGGLLGFVLQQIMLHFDAEAETWFELATVMSGVVGVIFLLFTILLSVGIYFNIEVSMGFTRKKYFLSAFAMWTAACLLSAAAMALVCLAENAANRALHPALGCETDFLPYLLKWSVPAAVVLTALSLFGGALIVRFGRRAYWILWGCWMFLCIGGPRIGEAMTDAPNSVFGRLGRVVAAVIAAVPGNAWIWLAGIAAAAGLAGGYAVLRRQQVNS